MRYTDHQQRELDIASGEEMDKLSRITIAVSIKFTCKNHPDLDYQTVIQVASLDMLEVEAAIHRLPFIGHAATRGFTMHSYRWH